MFRMLLITPLLLMSAAAAAQLSHDTDVAVRLDDSSDRDLRGQYRLRIRPRIDVDDKWSLHAFIATGEEFESAYNTIDENDDQIHVRRLFARYELETGSKLEVGVIPPFKGRVSSTGLSKEGWIGGARGVWRRRAGAMELVVGSLDDLRARQALGADFDVDYYEFEYSAQASDTWSFEVGAERMFDSNFFRTELRFEPRGQASLAAELIHNVSENSSKVVFSALREFTWRDQPVEWFSYYSYTGRDFGRRADLAEDFLEFGHAIATKVEGGFSRAGRAGWFAEIEVYENRTRAKLGIEIDLH